MVTNICIGTPDEHINRWGKFAFEHFKKEFNGPNAAAAGIQLMTDYILLEEHQDDTIPAWKDIVYDFKVLDSSDIEKMGLPAKYVKGFSFGTFVIEQKYYMNFLTNILLKKGVVFEQRKVKSLDEFNDSSYDCVVNCAGLGSYELLSDEDMYPVRGQVLRVKYDLSYLF